MHSVLILNSQLAEQTPSGKKIEISTLSSLYHIEVNPSEAGNNDYSVIRELLKEIAETAQLDSSKQRSFKGMRPTIAQSRC